MQDFNERNQKDHNPQKGQASNSEVTEARSAPVYRTSDYITRQSAFPPPPPPRVSDVRERIQRRRTQNRGRHTEWAWVIVAGTLFSIVLFISLGALLLVQASQNEVEIIPTADVLAALPTPLVVRNEYSADWLSIGDELVMPDGSSIALVPWDGQSRFTMVMVGLDRRPGERGLAYRTDTIMLISVDPQSQRIGVLSIPRDLYVQIPGYSQLQRVNSPLVFGETQRAGYGPTLMMQTIQLNLGIRVNDYVAVDFQAFIDLINAIGGITVETTQTINDRLYPDMNYGYDPFYLPAGRHQLNGYNALRFARTRHGDSDIERAKRQQQVLYAVRDRILSLDMLPSLLLQAPSLWSSLQDNVYTGLSLEQIIQLGLFVKDIPLENIEMGVIDFRFPQSYSMPDGQSVLIPSRARLGELMVSVFGTNYTQ